MALVVLRTVQRLGNGRLAGRAALYNVQTASITTVPDSRTEKPKPWPYRQKRFGIINQPFDKTATRFDNNSKVIVVDGPIASGKEEFAKRLAKQLNFFYVPQVPVEELYKVDGGKVDWRALDELLPPAARIYDTNSFYNDPHSKVSEGGGRVGMLQVDHFIVRLLTYNDAMLHLFSTGQGVVCVRSPWSDLVFANALLENGYYTKKGFGYYNDVSRNAVCEYPRPHLTIYLDAQVAQVKENIIKRNKPLEMKGLERVMTDKFLLSIERAYKDKVLPLLKSHGEVLVYPYIPNVTDHEIELMVEDIEALGSLSHSGLADDSKLVDWRIMKNEELAALRRQWDSSKFLYGILSHGLPYDSPEMVMQMSDEQLRERVYSQCPAYVYQDGWQVGYDSYMKIMFGAFRKAKELRKFYVPPAPAAFA